MKVPAGSPQPAKKGGKERRQHFRFNLDKARLIVYPDGLLVKFGLGRQNRALTALDVSEGGLQIVVTNRLEPGTKVHIKLRPDKFYADEIEAVGEVRWCYQDPAEPGKIRVGVMFLDLSPEQSEKLARIRKVLEKHK